MSVDPLRASEVVRPVARNRTRMPGGRLNCVNVRLTDEEMSGVSAAAARAGLKPTSYAGEVTVAAARADAQGSVAGATRAELARVQREVLRVLYLTANPEMNLRTEVEVRDVQQAVRKATHRDLIEISYRPAATPEDLLDGLNDLRPHVVHFSGHAGNAAVLFDNASVDTPDSRKVTFDLLARVLDATSSPPALLVLNGCDTLDGAEVLLDSTPVVIAMAAEITDLAASAFAARFYSAIASAQPIGPAVRQGAVALDLAGLNEGWKPTVSARDDVDLERLLLVRPTPE